MQICAPAASVSECPHSLWKGRKWLLGLCGLEGVQKFLGNLRRGFKSFRVWCQWMLTQGGRRNTQLLSSGERVVVMLKSLPEH